jgi:hypothetical protein
MLRMPRCVGAMPRSARKADAAQTFMVRELGQCVESMIVGGC